MGIKRIIRSIIKIESQLKIAEGELLEFDKRRRELQEYINSIERTEKSILGSAIMPAAPKFTAMENSHFKTPAQGKARCIS